MRGLYKGGVPALLSASTTIAPGASAIADSGRLQNPFRNVMAIEEIRFITRVASPPTVDLVMANAIGAKLHLGRYAVSQDFIPLVNYCSLADTRTGVTSVETIGATAAYSINRWRLDVPLLVAPGDVLSCSYQRNTSTVGGELTATVEVAYSGRVLPDSFRMPNKVRIPYVSMFKTGEAVGAAMSNDIHLNNPFQVPLTVHQLTGRVAVRTSNVVAASPLVKIYTLDGHNMIRDFYTITFDPNNSTWFMNHTMRPREAILAQLQAVLGLRVVCLAAISSREEEL